jgi:hypothetical protein
MNSEGCHWLHPCKSHRRRPYVRVVVAIGVVLFTLWNFSISTRVVPRKDYQLKVETDMLDSYLAEGESAAKSALAATTHIADHEVASSPSSAAPVLPSKAYNKTLHKKRVEEEEHSDDSLSLSTNSSLAMVDEKQVDVSSITTVNSSTLVLVSNINSPSINNNTTSVTSPPANDTDYDKYGLPEWITNYFAWHGQMRQQFPDEKLYEHDDAPQVLLKYCKWQQRVICGGLYDRMSSIPKILYVANQTNRVLLIKWYVPMKLPSIGPPRITIDSVVAISFATIYRNQSTQKIKRFSHGHWKSQLWRTTCWLCIVKPTTWI